MLVRVHFVVIFLGLRLRLWPFLLLIVQVGLDMVGPICILNLVVVNFWEGMLCAPAAVARTRLLDMMKG